MNITLWKILLVISTLSIIISFWYIQRSKKYTGAIKIAFFVSIGVIFLLLYQSYIWYNKKYNRPISKKIYRVIVPLEVESHIKGYLKTINEDRPVVIAIPLIVQIRFTDPMSPNSPHALCYIFLKNVGNLKAADVDIKWEINDNGNRITPPDEWNKIIGRKEEAFVLNPNQFLTYLYGPEIGAYAQKTPPNIELTLRVKYKGENGKEYNYFCRSKSNPEPKPKDTYTFDILDVK
ncbi:MAG: hypothetical protein PHT41_00125 [Candidatus Omnitrophica bacterium]|nr:hypothetical protein [Candidatus Omnitrophota bacterium]